MMPGVSTRFSILGEERGEKSVEGRWTMALDVRSEKLNRYYCIDTGRMSS